MKACRTRQEQKQVDDPSRRESSDEGEVEEMDAQHKLRVHDIAPGYDEEGTGQVKERGASNEPNDDEIDDEDEGVESEAGQDEVIKMQVCDLSQLIYLMINHLFHCEELSVTST